MTAVLSWHVQNITAITWLKCLWEQNEIDIESAFPLKNCWCNGDGFMSWCCGTRETIIAPWKISLPGCQEGKWSSQCTKVKVCLRSVATAKEWFCIFEEIKKLNLNLGFDPFFNVSLVHFMYVLTGWGFMHLFINDSSSCVNLSMLVLYMGWYSYITFCILPGESWDQTISKLDVDLCSNVLCTSQLNFSVNVENNNHWNIFNYYTLKVIARHPRDQCFNALYASLIALSK